MGLGLCYPPLILENNLKRGFGKLSNDSNYADKNLNYKRNPPRGKGGRNCTWALLGERNDGFLMYSTSSPWLWMKNNNGEGSIYSSTTLGGQENPKNRSLSRRTSHLSYDKCHLLYDKLYHRWIELIFGYVVLQNVKYPNLRVNGPREGIHLIVWLLMV